MRYQSVSSGALMNDWKQKQRSIVCQKVDASTGIGRFIVEIHVTGSEAQLDLDINRSGAVKRLVMCVVLLIFGMIGTFLSDWVRLR